MELIKFVVFHIIDLLLTISTYYIYHGYITYNQGYISGGAKWINSSRSCKHHVPHPKKFCGKEHEAGSLAVLTYALCIYPSDQRSVQRSASEAYHCVRNFHPWLYYCIIRIVRKIQRVLRVRTVYEHFDTDERRIIKRVDLSTATMGCGKYFDYLQLSSLKETVDIFWSVYDIVTKFRWVYT